MFTIDLTGKNAIVTGASSGLGVEMAKALAQAGARVALVARRRDRLDAVLAEIGVGAIALECNVADAAAVAQMAEEATRQLGRIDILVNNAGVATDGGPVPEKIPHADFEHTMHVNVNGLWYCCREVGARMLADGLGGSIINIASVAGVSGWPEGPTAYQASKGAVIQITRNLAASWSDRGVRVNALAPGWFPSEMTAPLMKSPDYLRYMQDSAPMRRIGRPEEIAGPVVFLASEASSFVNGLILTVDGGSSACFGYMPAPESHRQFLATFLPGGIGAPIGK